MKKAFLKYLISLCILLLSGYGYSHAYTYQDVISGSPLENSVRVKADALSTARPTTVLISQSSSSSSGTATKHTKKLITTEYEVEEDQWVAFKKLLESGHFVTAVIYAFICGFLFRYSNKGFLFCKHFYHILPYRWHLMIRVFRI